MAVQNKSFFTIKLKFANYQTKLQNKLTLKTINFAKENICNFGLIKMK